LQIQAALVICGLFICDFVYVRSRNDLFSGTYPLIISHPWSFYMRIHYTRVYFWSPYPSHITRSNCNLSNAIFSLFFDNEKLCSTKKDTNCRENDFTLNSAELTCPVATCRTKVKLIVFHASIFDFWQQLGNTLAYPPPPTIKTALDFYTSKK